MAPSLALMTMRTGAQWHMMLHDLPLWATVSQQRQRWLQAGVFEVIVSDVRTLSLIPPSTLT